MSAMSAMSERGARSAMRFMQTNNATRFGPEGERDRLWFGGGDGDDKCDSESQVPSNGLGQCSSGRQAQCVSESRRKSFLRNEIPERRFHFQLSVKCGISGEQNGAII